ncbi:uncharacterized protein LOC135388271 [Ornithodoros turicata]|uniref:uncharacterized protein LOC135388271 n=1 Tax=Ornithodoros turicata TaxID=34597 RepID=UPI003138CE90
MQGKLASAIASYWPKIRDFAVLDTELHPTTSSNYIDEVTRFLREADKNVNNQIRAEIPPRRTFGYVLLGVALIRGSQPASILLTNFNRLVQAIELDALLYRTSLIHNIMDRRVCVSTGPSPWTGSGVPSMQPCFVDSLEFRAQYGHQALPSKTAELLSFSAAAFLTTYDGPNSKRSPIAPCLTITRINPKEVLCEGGQYHQIATNQSNYLETDSSRYDKRGSVLQRTVAAVIDSNCTMDIKMCLAKSMYGFTGGYVIFDMHFHYMCRQPPQFIDIKGDFGFVKWAEVISKNVRSGSPVPCAPKTNIC